MSDYLPITPPGWKVTRLSDVASYQNADAIKDALARQLYSPVRWVETVQAVYQQGVLNSAECGPGKVLSGLTKRIVSELPCTAFTSSEAIREFIENNK